jgi:LmbE family N-acetylglucosaminyl deacetylase
MTEKRALLAVLAHPDDESYGPGGALARYARNGVDVHVAIATDGAAGSIDEKWQGDRTRLAEARVEELDAATEILGITLHRLGYRDSGYISDEANNHPSAFINADEDEAVCRVVKLIREIRPQVILTHDETGGYFHPDHIQCCTITTAAFHAAGDPDKYPNIGPGPYQCSGKFERGSNYYHVRHDKSIRFSNATAFMAQDRETVEEAWPGDIVGIYDTGNLKIGDTLTEGEKAIYTGIPSFSTEIFK